MLAYSLLRDCKKKKEFTEVTPLSFDKYFMRLMKEGEQRQNRTGSEDSNNSSPKQTHSCYGNISKAIVHNTFISKNIYFCILAASYNFKCFDNRNSDGLNKKLCKLLTP